MRCRALRKTKGREQRPILVVAPLRDGQHREMIGQDRPHRQGQDGGQAIAGALAAARIGDRHQGGEQDGENFPTDLCGVFAGCRGLDHVGKLHRALLGRWCLNTPILPNESSLPVRTHKP